MTDQEKIGIIKDFVKFVYYELDIHKSPVINFTEDHEFTQRNRSFGSYSPSTDSIVVYTKNRNLADILRSLAHELVHHRQNEMGYIEKGSGETGNPIENEANSTAGILMRKYGKKNSLIYENKSSLYSLIAEDIETYYVYCDMDGVLCDYYGAFEHYFGMSSHEYVKEKSYKQYTEAINEIGIEFWSKMPMLKGANELWQKISKHNVTILTSPAHFEYAVKGKNIWIQENLHPSPKNIVFKQTGHKHEVLTRIPIESRYKHILIDDMSKNTIPWGEMGGQYILYKDFQSAKPKLDKLL